MPTDYDAMARQHGGRLKDEEYDAIAAQSGGKPAGAGQRPGKQDAVGRFREEAWKRIDPVEQYRSFATATTQPLAALGAMGRAQGSLLEMAGESYNRGDYAKALRQGIHYLIPIFGPDMEAAAELFGKGDYGGGAGATTGTLLSLVHPEMVRKGVPVVPRIDNLNPLERKAVDYALSEGVPLSAGTATGNRYLRGAEYATANTPLGSLAASGANRRVEPALQRAGGRLAERALPGRPMSPERAATEVKGTLQSTTDDYFSRADKQYAPWRQAEAQPTSIRSVQQGVDTKGNPLMEDVPMPVDVRNIKAAIRPLYEKIDRAWEPSRKYSSQGLQAMRSILEGKDFISSSDAELSLGGLKRMSREDPEGIAGGVIARQIIPDLQKTVDSSVRAISPQAATKLQRGRILTRRAHEVKEILDDLREEPVQAYGQMTYRQDAGINRLRNIEKEAPGSLQTVGRAYLESLIEEAGRGGGFSRTQGILGKWNSLGPETKKLLFPHPLLRQNIGQFLLAAQKYGESPNPSGTAGVLTATGTVSGGAAIADPVATILTNVGAGAVAKALYSPRTAKLLTRGLTVGGDRAARALWLTNIIKETGQDLTDEEKIRKQLKATGKKMLPYEYANPALDPRR